MSASLTWLADAIRAEGARVVEEGDWKHRGRSGAFDPYGVLWHHTGSTASYSNPFPTKNTLINGRPDLAGPLCQVGIGYDGVCHVIAAGRANHAGACNGFGPFTSTRDGNDQLVGFEIDYDGTQPMSPEQKDAATRCSAAVLKRFKRDESYAARHAETSTTGKWDTGGVTGDQLRAMISNYLTHGDGDDDMPLTADEIEAIAIQSAVQVWNRYKVYGIDNKATTPFGSAMTTMFQAAQRANNGTLAIEICDQVWKRYKVYDEHGNLVPLLTAIQVIYQDVEALSPSAFSAKTQVPDPETEPTEVEPAPPPVEA